MLARRRRVLPTIEAAIAARQDKGLAPEPSRLLVERNIEPCEGGFTWTTDQRLRGASAVKLGEEQVAAVLGALTMPTLLLLANQGLGGLHAELATLASQSIPGLELEYVDGSHHFHMEPVIISLVSRIMEFIGE